jgi:XTP/dITP diphosphohydrolase
VDCFILASHNRHKTAELRAILEPLGIDLRNLSDVPGAPEPVEDGETFEANAAIKALSARACSGLAAIADDSGLAVEALDGAPGIRSARFAGEDADAGANNALLLEMLSGVPPARRRAKFVSVVALALSGRDPVFFRGETAGVILDAPRGEGGFGYDPLFLSDDLGIAFAEAESAAKNRVSHRARALAQMIGWLGKR